MNFVLPTFYPTTIVFVDDEARIFSNLIDPLGLQRLPHRTFTEGQECLNFLNADTYRQDFGDKLLVSDPSDRGDGLSFDVTDLLTDLHTLDRYNQVSVLVLDYEMPGMRGLDICEKMTNPYTRKIMLTGEADETVAVDAFNKGQIHTYIRKHDVGFIKKLKAAILQAQQDYFRDLFRIPVEALVKRSESTALIDPVFIEHFQDLVQRHNIQEYYLVNGMGSFLMVDKDQKLYSLVTLDEDVLDIYINRQFMDEISPQVARKIESRERIPFYCAPFAYDPHEPDPEEGDKDTIEDYLFPPQTLRGKYKPYYTQFREGLIQVPPGKVALWNYEGE